MFFKKMAVKVFDHMLKRMSYRRQKRWWNAYMLFYCRADLDTPADTLTTGIQVPVLFLPTTVIRFFSPHLPRYYSFSSPREFSF
jgi:hypothetical protein